MTPFLIRPAQRAGFSEAKGTKVDLFRGQALFLGLNCFEPGQSQAVHAHHGADKFYLIVSGKASMMVGDDRFEAEAGDLIWAPADVPHGVISAVEQTIMLIGIAPPPESSAKMV